MRLSDIEPRALEQVLADAGIRLRIGPFAVCLRSPIGQLASDLGLLYGDYPVAADEAMADFHLEITPARGLRRWLRPQAVFQFDGELPFQPVPKAHAMAVFEWGLNWVIVNNAHRYLIIHSAVVERNGMAVILPGAPGAGKSTLCAALVARGWRLLSDEMAMIDSADGSVVPIPRPISLKNQSVDIMRRFAPDLIFGPPFDDTTKGKVVHVRPPSSCVAHAEENSLLKRIVFPKYTARAVAELTTVTRGNAFMRLAEQSFNYSILGGLGFDLLASLVEDCEAADFTYSDLDDAVRILSAFCD
jgi:hypothetical protein